MSPRLLSIDIETVPTTRPCEFEDPTAWEIFAIAVGFRSGHASPVQSEVFVRSGDHNDTICVVEQRVNRELGHFQEAEA